MASPKLPLVKRLSNTLFDAVQKAIPPEQREAVKAEDWVKISRVCDTFALKIEPMVPDADDGE